MIPALIRKCLKWIETMTPPQNLQLQPSWPDSATFWRNKRVVVTGCSGFLGFLVVDKLPRTIPTVEAHHPVKPLAA